jgi:DNA-binding response OmpR family regulator
MNRKILFIEDDISFLNVYKEAFIQKNIQCIEAMTGKDGLRKVASEKPDVIVLDIMLPGGISGFDVLEQLKANPLTKDIPVIVLTNLDSEAAVAKKIGAWDYRIKSNTTLKEIVDLIQECLNSLKSS